MPTLLEVQQAMSRSLFGAENARGLAGSGESTPPASVPGLSPAALERLSIYRNTCRSTLVRALSLSFPAVQRLVGPEFFECAAQRFIDESASGVPQSAWLNEYGHEFSAFLASFPPAAGLRYLADVARLEQAVNEALYAPEAAPLDAAQLASRIAGQTEVRFLPHPSIRLLRLQYPADVIWRGVLEHDDAALASVDLASGPVWLLVERAESGVQAERLTEHAWWFTERLCTGLPLSAALAAFPAEGVAAAPSTEPHWEAANLLAQHLAAGRFIDALSMP